jgi:hypothetical protein
MGGSPFLASAVPRNQGDPFFTDLAASLGDVLSERDSKLRQGVCVTSPARAAPLRTACCVVAREVLSARVGC